MRIQRRPVLGRFFAPAAFGALFLILGSLLRIVLLAQVWHSIRPNFPLVLRVLGSGVLYDAAAATFALTPYVLWLALAPSRLLGSRAGRLLSHAALLFAIATILFGVIAEWLFFAEFGARFNFIAVDYLVYTRELAQNAWESYPIPLLLGAIFALSLAIWWPLRHRLSGAFAAHASLRTRGAAAALAALASAAVFLGVDSRSASVDTNHYANEVAKSGVYELFSAFRHNELDYAPFYVSASDSVALGRAHELVAGPSSHFVSDDPHELVREVTPPGPERRWNVVLVVVESLSAEYVGRVDDKGRALTPRLSELAKQSIHFTNLYATGTRTVRGLEAVSLSIPPTPGQSIVKRAGNGGLFTIGTPFLDRGYDVRFHYGGFGFFDNMNAFFGGNGFEVVDRASLSADEVTFANAWGVADEDLYRRTLREGDRSYAAGRPFFSFVMTTSNHRPYTYPEGRVSIPSKSGRHGAVQYTDWAIGDFLDQAAKRPWFSDTLFVIVADHCANSAGKTEIPVERYRIPLFLYAPAHLVPRSIDGLASQMDVAPTILGVLGFRYQSRFFGRDLLAPSSGEPRALLSTYQNLGLLQNGILTVLSPGQRVDAYRVYIGNPKETEIPPDPAAVRDTIAYYQAASWLWKRGALRDERRQPEIAER